jgi:hypothetical protein
MSFLSWRSMTKTAGFRSGSGSISQRHGSTSTPKCYGSGTLLEANWNLSRS